MNTTIIKTAGVLNASKIIIGGYTFMNPTGEHRSDKDMEIYTRIPNMGEGSIMIIIRAYDGELGTSASVWTPVKTEIVDGVTIRTYKTYLSSNSVNRTDREGNIYIGRNIYTKTVGIKRIDIIGENLDIRMLGSSADGYSQYYVIDSDQIKYSDIPQNSKYLTIDYNTGALKTEWFKNNTILEYFNVIGDKTHIEGTIMDFVNCGNTLNYLNFYTNTGVYGDIREYLDALKSKGVKNKTIDIRISSCPNITNDVTTAKSPVYATFDANGDWTASNSAPV